MRWSERWAAVRSTFWDDFHTFTPSDARPGPPSLILFSLDAKAHPYDIILAAAYRGRFGHVRRSRCNRNRGAHFGGGFASSTDASGVYTFDFWLRVSISRISALHGARVGATGSSSYGLLYRCYSRDFALSHCISAVTVVFRLRLSRSMLRHRSMRACLGSHTTCFPFGCASSR